MDNARRTAELIRECDLEGVALAVAGFALVCVLELTAGRKAKNAG